MTAQTNSPEDRRSMELSEIEKGLKAIEVQNKILKQLLQESNKGLGVDQQPQKDEATGSSNDESINRNK